MSRVLVRAQAGLAPRGAHPGGLPGVEIEFRHGLEYPKEVDAKLNAAAVERRESASPLSDTRFPPVIG